MSAAPDSRPRLLLHIGPHKTGSTSIQRHCAAIRADLARAGCCYPQAGCWGDQHLLLPASLLAQHPFVPRELLGQGPEPVLAALAAEVPPGHTTLLSSEVFWELLMHNPVKAEALFRRLLEAYDLTVLLIERPEEERLWSSIKHTTRAGLALDAAERYERKRQNSLAAGKRLAALGCATRRLPFPADGGDVVETFLAALPEGGEAGVIEALVAQRRASAGVGSRANVAPIHPSAAAFCFEFARRVQAEPQARQRRESFLLQAIQAPDSTAAWEGLPDEAELRRRLVAAQGQPGSLLTPTERAAWESSLRLEWLVRLAEATGCAEDLAAIATATAEGTGDRA